MRKFMTIFHFHIWKKTGPNKYICRFKHCEATGAR